jgi:hypothetical protein
MTVKMPEPMTAPMPSAVSDHGPRVFLRECPGSSESRISLSMDLQAISWLGRACLLVRAGVNCCRCRRFSAGSESLCRSVHDEIPDGDAQFARGAGAERVPAKQEGGVQEREIERRFQTGRAVAARPGTAHACGGLLPLGLAAGQFLDLFLVGAARGGPLGFGGSLLAGCALDLLPFQLVFNLLCVCQC